MSKRLPYFSYPDSLRYSNKHVIQKRNPQIDTNFIEMNFKFFFLNNEQKDHFKIYTLAVLFLFFWQRGLLEVLYDIFRLPLPVVAEEFIEALLSVGKYLEPVHAIILCIILFYKFEPFTVSSVLQIMSISTVSSQNSLSILKSPI